MHHQKSTACTTVTGVAITGAVIGTAIGIAAVGLMGASPAKRKTKRVIRRIEHAAMNMINHH